MINYDVIDGTKSYSKDEFMTMVLGSLSESVWKDENIAVDRIKMVVSMFVDHPDLKKRIAILAKDGDKVVGLLAAMSMEDGLIGKSMASELMWYVLPKYRKNKIADNLMAMYEQWARVNDIQYITMAHYDNEVGNTVSKLYKRRGFRKMEVTYIKELK